MDQKKSKNIGPGVLITVSGDFSEDKSRSNGRKCLYLRWGNLAIVRFILCPFHDEKNVVFST